MVRCLSVLPIVFLSCLLLSCGDGDGGNTADTPRDTGTDAAGDVPGTDVPGTDVPSTDVPPVDMTNDAVDAADADMADMVGMPPPQGETLPLPTAITTFYVSSSLGDDAWSGSLPEPNGNGDGPKASLDAALDLLDGAAPGTHVLLRQGDTWNPAAGLEVRAATGTTDDPVVLGAYGMGAQPQIIAQHTNNVFVIRGNANGTSAWFRMHNLRISAATEADGQLGIYIGESFHPEVPHHITFSNLTIEGVGAGMTMYGDNHLVHGSRIAHNHFGMGIFVTGNDVSFRYNQFEDNGLPPPDVFVHSLYISNCDGVLFEHNEVYNATDGVKVRRTNRGTFRHNTFHDIVNFGIHLGGDSEGGTVDNRIEANVFYDNAGDIVIKSESGVQTEDVDGLVIANNIVQAGPIGVPSGYGYSISLIDVPARNVSIVNNLLYDLGESGGIRVGNDGANITCANNIVVDFANARHFDINAAVAANANIAVSNQNELDALSLSDPMALDYDLTQGSTALIDQGVDVSSALSEDYQGRPRPIGGGFDIGPHEFDPAE